MPLVAILGEEFLIDKHANVGKHFCHSRMVSVVSARNYVLGFATKL